MTYCVWSQSALWDLPNALISAHCMDWTDDAVRFNSCSTVFQWIMEDFLRSVNLKVDKTASAWVRNVEGFARSGVAGLEGVVQPDLGY